MPTRPPTHAPRRKRASVSDAEANKALHEGVWEEVSEPTQEITIVPAEFSRMPDGVLAVAMARYHDVLDAGRAEVHAITEGVIAAKLYAREHKLPYRKEE